MPAAQAKPRLKHAELPDFTIPVIIGLLVLRSANAYLTSTFFQPDEYFQALEPAWQLAFGDGAWLTWEWREGLRSAIHPVLFAAIYKAVASVAALLSLNQHARAELLVAAPRLLQVPIAAGIDFYTWRLSQSIYGEHSKESVAALLVSVWSPWQWYCSTRTFSNTLETFLTVIALAWWPWRWTNGVQVNGNATAALGIAALACLLRPTNSIIWMAIIGTALYQKGNRKMATTLIRQAVIAGSAVLAISVSIDRAYYGQWTVPQFQFLYLNVFQSLSTFYGHNRLDYYFTEGIPLLLTTALPFGIIGFWQAIRHKPTSSQTRFLLAVAAAVTVLAFTSIAHKEVRFVYPLLPILHVLAAQPLASFFTLFPVEKNKLRVGLLIFGLTINLYIMAYTAMVHQRGVIDVMHFLRHEAQDTATSMTVGFLMPCHSTPWRSHFVHSQIDAWALTCEPPLGVPLELRDQYQDEADVFYNHPRAWMDQNLVDHKSILKAQPFTRPEPHDNQRPWPDYLIYFEQLEPIMNKSLEHSRYSEVARFFNTHWHDDWRRQGDVIVQKLDPK